MKPPEAQPAKSEAANKQTRSANCRMVHRELCSDVQGRKATLAGWEPPGSRMLRHLPAIGKANRPAGSRFLYPPSIRR
jgi:hypothetical protein